MENLWLKDVLALLIEDVLACTAGGGGGGGGALFLSYRHNFQVIH